MDRIGGSGVFVGLRKAEACPPCDDRAIAELDAIDSELARIEHEQTRTIVDLKDELNAEAVKVFRELVRFAIHERGQSFRSIAKLSGCTHVAIIDAYKGKRRGSWYMTEALHRIPGVQLIEARIRSQLARQEALVANG